MTQPAEENKLATSAVNTRPVYNLDPNPKPGIKTTEFWKSLGFNVISLLTMVGAIHPTGNPKYDSWIRVAAAISAAINNIGYFRARAITKASTVSAVAEMAKYNY